MYMSPEVIKGSTEGRLSSIDVWSLGCVVLEMATGRRPWASLDNEWAIMYNIAQGNPPQLPSKDQISSEGLDFLKKCFTRDPSKRATAQELLQTKWMVQIKEQLSLGGEADVVQTPSSEGSSSLAGSRQGSTYG
jgi:mitogen-activated protein kinase kinase kinase